MKMGCDVVTVSTDTQFVHLASRRHERELSAVTYPMAADPTGSVCFSTIPVTIVDLQEAFWAIPVAGARQEIR